MTYKIGSTLFIIVTTGVLSLGQAWALRAGNGRALRLFLVWIAACLTMLAITAAILDLGHAPPEGRRGAIESILVLAGCLALLALAAGAHWGAARARGIGCLSIGEAGACLGRRRRRKNRDADSSE